MTQWTRFSHGSIGGTVTGLFGPGHTFTQYLNLMGAGKFFLIFRFFGPELTLWSDFFQSDFPEYYPSYGPIFLILPSNRDFSSSPTFR